MRFTKLVAMVAIIGWMANATAQEDGTLRESNVVILNSNTNTNSNTAIQQPTTVVEAAPAQESRAELMRKARQNAEVQTEQKIVEKLEESRLREENERAERLFGNKLESGGAAATATAVATPNGAAATATAVAVPVTEPVKEEKPTQVTIEKVEIVAPVAPITPIKEEPPVTSPVSEIKSEIKESQEPDMKKWYATGIVGVPSYQASNIKTNYALGVSVGTITSPRWAVEGTFMYSNHNVDTFWDPQGIFRDLDQYDFQAAAKYFLMEGQLRPYLGGSLTYIYRKYSDRVDYGSSYSTSWSAYDGIDDQEETHALNAGLVGGVEFAISPDFAVGGGLDYNWNLASKNDFNSSNIPHNSTPLEEIEYWTLKLGATVRF